MKNYRLTNKEIIILENSIANQNGIITDEYLINKLAKLGIVEKHAHTNKKVYWYFGHVIARYVNDVRYTTIDQYAISAEYVDGTFYPYVKASKIDN